MNEKNCTQSESEGEKKGGFFLLIGWGLHFNPQENYLPRAERRGAITPRQTTYHDKEIFWKEARLATELTERRRKESAP